ncbi:hypothetical protein PUN28_014535 [Cardiocondyla obscurior]|uniref:Uncharacterized protein n=1 Tax=Cardiocondyla obscurior TaxID=286306 RepID=A0AAW2F3S7_9HYME
MTAATTAAGIPRDNGKNDLQSTRSRPRVYKIVVLGDGGVGKSGICHLLDLLEYLTFHMFKCVHYCNANYNCVPYFSAVTLQFVSHRFLDYHDPTIEDSYQTQVVIDGEAALLDILDTAGQVWKQYLIVNDIICIICSSYIFIFRLQMETILILCVQVEFTAMREQYMRCGEGFMICYSVTDRHSFQETMEYRKLISRVRANENIPLVLVGNKFDLQHHRKVTTEEGKALAEELGCPFYETSAALRQFIDDAFFSLIRQIRAKERSRNSHRKRSRWWRIRSIFAFIFRRRRHTSNRTP